MSSTCNGLDGSLSRVRSGILTHLLTVYYSLYTRSVQAKDFSRLLGLQAPWEVTNVTLAPKKREVQIHVTCKDGEALTGPPCDVVSPRYDHRHRQWRHLDMCAYRTMVMADLPRVDCPTHGVRTVALPWAEAKSRFTAAFESLVVDWLQEASVSAGARLMGMSWTAIDRIMQRAVQRGLAGRQEQPCAHIGVDETSFRKRHDYVTIVSDAQAGTVLYVGQDRTKAALAQWYTRLTSEQLESIKSVSMDRGPAYINATLEHVPGARQKVAFDRFHVTQCLNTAVDQGRRQEHRALMKQGLHDLKGTRYDGLTNPANMSDRQMVRFEQLRTRTLKTARAGAIKDRARQLWHYASRTWARRDWERWLSWAMRCRLEPVKAAARTIKRHLWGILNAMALKVSNGPAESLNSRIKTIKVRSRGFRNQSRLAHAIYFHLGGLDLYPESVRR